MTRAAEPEPGLSRADNSTDGRARWILLDVDPELGIAVQLRDVTTLDDLANVTAPCPVEPGDLVATAMELYRVEVVLWTPPWWWR